MGVAEIVGFAACWLVVASLMLWGVFTEHKRGGPAAPTARPLGEWHPSRSVRVSPIDWIVVETNQGVTPEAAAQARMITAAWLASRGIDIDSLPPSDIRTEVTSTGDGTGTTRILVRAGALNASRRHR
ncbi:MAG TPA: hypothetical protein VLX59_04170 [Acidimicrobiales bacterium]|nr:hypothetical protein [Acidimicrobiales bacterium]